MSLRPAICPHCGGDLDEGELVGNCPHCLAERLLEVDSTAERSEGAEEIIRVVDGYELIEEIARGGAGVVYRARQAELGREVAVKLLRDGTLADPMAVERFAKEAREAGRLSHPGIVPVLEFGRADDGQHYLAMPLVNGPNLAQITQNGPLPALRAAELVAKIALAIQHAHERGVLHRDLKPSNVLLDLDGEPHVTDFGLARPLDDGSSLTLTGQLIGTPSFMAPEQADSRQAAGPGADIYSLGALLFHLVTGRPPFVGGTLAELLRNVSEHEPVSPRLLNPAVPEDLASVCLKCLRKEPAERYRRASELAGDLHRFLRGETTHAKPATAAERVVRWCRRRPAVAGLLAALAIVAVTGAAGILWQWREAAVARRQADQSAEQLWASAAMGARYWTHSGLPGQRTNALSIIRNAARMRPSLELRNEALAALLLPDIGEPLSWKEETSFLHPWCYDPELNYYLPHTESGPITLCRARDHAIEVDLGPGPGQPNTAMFSPDGRLVAVMFDPGGIRVWEWRSRRLLARLETGVKGWAARSYDFSPTSRTLYFDDATNGVSSLDLATGVVTPVKDIGSVSLVRVSPSGTRLAIARGNDVAVWELDPPRRLAGITLTGATASLRSLAWHPNEGFLALGAEGGLSLWDWRSNEARRLNAVGYFRDLFFNALGDLLFAEGDIWDVASQTRVFRGGADLGAAVALSRDETRIALRREKVGFGVWEYLSPLSGRAFLDGVHPLSYSWPSTDVSADGRWLLSSHRDGWRLWSVPTGRIVARNSTLRVYDVRFAGSDHSFVTVGDDGVNRWQFLASGQSTSDDVVRVGSPAPLFAGSSPNGGCLSKGARYAATASNTGLVVVDLERREARPAIELRDPADNVFQLSPDGRWLTSNHHNKSGADLWDATSGRYLMRLAEPAFPSCQFQPDGEALVSWNGIEFIQRRPGDWSPVRSFRWPLTNTQLLTGGIGERGRILWCAIPDQRLSLLDGVTGEPRAILGHPGGYVANAVSLHEPGGLAFASSTRELIWMFDTAGLRLELRKLGLDWRDDGGSRQP